MDIVEESKTLSKKNFSYYGKLGYAAKEKYKRERKAVREAKCCWYLEKLPKKDIHIFFINTVYSFADESHEFILKYVGKSVDELCKNGTVEEVFKAVFINEFIFAIENNEESVIKFLGCECPDEVLIKARLSVLISTPKNSRTPIHLKSRAIWNSKLL